MTLEQMDQREMFDDMVRHEYVRLLEAKRLAKKVTRGRYPITNKELKDVAISNVKARIF